MKELFTCLRLPLLACLLMIGTKGGLLAQSAPLCVDFKTIALEANCLHTIMPLEVLEGGPYPNVEDFIVQLDKTAPLGNGPFVPADLSTADFGKTYQVRVTDPATTNKCWGTVKIASYVACSGLTTIQLDSTGQTVLQANAVDALPVDVCVPANTLTIATINELSLLSLTCADKGVQNIELGLYDQLGNTSFCQSTLLVLDSEAVCDTCWECPASVVVPYQEASSILLPALQTQNLAAFDVYGDATLLPGCTFDDTTYAVTYVGGLADFSWFERTWRHYSVDDTLLGSCVQSIVFEFDRNITIQGIAFIDSISNCLYDPEEQGFSAPKLKTTILPSGQSTVTAPDVDGQYTLMVHLTGLDSLVVLEWQLPDGMVSPCPNTRYLLAADTFSVYDFDFGIQLDSLCRNLDISLETPFMRRCFGNTYYLKYCNLSLYTADSVSVEVSLDPLLSVTATSIPWSTVQGNVYTFPIGTVSPFGCGTFTINADLSCDALLDQTICSNAIIFPNQLCGAQPWSGPIIDTRAICEGDTVQFTIYNNGIGDMDDPLNFIVIEDIIMYRMDDFQLIAGDSTNIRVEANGATWRIETELPDNYPDVDQPFSTVETCGGFNNPGLVNAFPLYDRAPFRDINCTEAVGSFDPNDKQASPKGFGPENRVRANTDLEYKIRFQNTGTDTAFRVVIIDTLSTLLDFASIRVGASSHPYQVQVFEGGILHFVFDPIALPDSNVNEPASHGFISFRMSQQPNLPNGTIFHNTASIYFDFNEAVVTNTVTHTIGELEQVVVSGVSNLPTNTPPLTIQPNPMQDDATIDLPGGISTLQIFNNQGVMVQNTTVSGKQYQLHKNELGAGMYYLKLVNEGHTLAHGKLIVL